MTGSYLDIEENKKELKKRVKKLLKESISGKKNPKFSLSTKDLPKGGDSHEFNFNELVSKVEEVAEEVSGEVYKEIRDELSQEELDKLHKKKKNPGKIKFGLDNVRERTNLKGSHENEAVVGGELKIEGESMEKDLEEFWRSKAQSEMSKIGRRVLEDISRSGPDKKEQEFNNVLARGLSETSKEKLNGGEKDQEISKKDRKKLLFKTSLDVLSNETEDYTLKNDHELELSKLIKKSPLDLSYVSEQEVKDIGEYYLLNLLDKEYLSDEEEKKMRRIENRLGLKEKVGTEDLELHEQLSERFYDEAEKRYKDIMKEGTIEEREEKKIKEAYEEIMEKSKGSKDRVKGIDIQLIARKAGVRRREAKKALDRLAEKEEIGREMKRKIGSDSIIESKGKGSKVFEKILREFPNSSLYRRRIEEIEENIEKIKELNPEKYKEAKKRLNEIRNEFIKVRRSGKFNKKNRKKLQKELKRANKEINEELSAGIKKEDVIRKSKEKVDKRKKFDKINAKEKSEKERKAKKSDIKRLKEIQEKMEKTIGKGTELQKTLQELEIPISSKQIENVVSPPPDLSFIEDKKRREEARSIVKEMEKNKKRYLKSIKKAKKYSEKGKSSGARKESRKAYKSLKDLIKGKKDIYQTIRSKKEMKGLKERLATSGEERKRKREFLERKISGIKGKKERRYEKAIKEAKEGLGENKERKVRKGASEAYKSLKSLIEHKKRSSEERKRIEEEIKKKLKNKEKKKKRRN